MYDGSRVTDAVEYWRRRGELKGALTVVRGRKPERFRWRRAVGAVSQSVGALSGRDRMRVEEPVREIVLDLGDDQLRREVVIDARRWGVDLDRGEVLPRRTLAELQRIAFLSGTDLSRVSKHVRLPDDREAPIDTAGVIVVGRALADQYKVRAQRLLLQVPDEDGPEPLRVHHRIMVERAAQDRADSQRWFAFARALLETR
ncbi:hypothetical protein [Sandaracinus amylolyticus]|uniref:Uncharacterized protein n=1 Tax=Sandaracinus amylolyticus TaxID=927083 RepID=A0A0F6YJX2_9BACT|nr:hypothetical protein [Sandaracinus amylolyticus]AKF08595.1 hypothetical protein DB32_005744 [Sandaracinus amylolyticus]